MPIRRALLPLPLLAVALVAACSGAGGGPDGATIEATGAWARPSSMVAGAGGAYLTIRNTGDAPDALVGASSPAAATVEVHETYEMPTPSESGGTGGGMHGMRPIPRLEIPAGGSVALEPGGYHLMLIDLVNDLEPGSSIEITLRFERAGEVIVTAEVREG